MKDFLTFDEQIEKIKEKGIIVKDIDVENVKKILSLENYYNVINGYKSPFLASGDDDFYPGTDINEIISLYFFDAYIRCLYLDIILILENQVKTAVAYEFSKVYGSNHHKYLNEKNFIGRQEKFKETLDKIKKMISEPKKEYIKHYKTMHNAIPLWVLINQFDFGTLITFYEHLQPCVRNEICSKFNLTNKDFKRFLKLTKFYRNICAHDDRFYCEKYTDEITKDSILLDYFVKDFNITDLENINSVFALTVILMYMSQPKVKQALLFGLLALKNYLNLNLKTISSNDIFKLMGFPDKWEDKIRDIFYIKLNRWNFTKISHRNK